MMPLGCVYKIKANASKHKAMSYGRMKQAAPALAAEVERWLAAAAETDAAEDRVHGVERRGDEMPERMANKQRRLEKIRTAKAALEAEARAAAAAQASEKSDGSGPSGPAHPPAEPAPPADKAQRNFTDPESRIMKTNDGFIQGYNAQAAVDAEAQVIVAHDLSNATTDQAQLAPLVAAIRTNLHRNPDEISAEPATAPRPISAPSPSAVSTPTSPPDASTMAPPPRSRSARPGRAAALPAWPRN